MINKYKELHEKLMDCFLQYHNLHTSWILKQTQRKTAELRLVLSEMRRIETELRAVAQTLMREESARKRKQWNRQQGDSK